MQQLSFNASTSLDAASSMLSFNLTNANETVTSNEVDQLEIMVERKINQSILSFLMYLEHLLKHLDLNLDTSAAEYETGWR